MSDVKKSHWKIGTRAKKKKKKKNLQILQGGTPTLQKGNQQEKKMGEKNENAPKEPGVGMLDRI